MVCKNKMRCTWASWPSLSVEEEEGEREGEEEGEEGGEWRAPLEETGVEETSKREEEEADERRDEI